MSTNLLQNYFDFKGRASRLEFWLFIITIQLIGFLIKYSENMFTLYPLYSDISVFSVIFVCLTFLPSLAISVRRLHDTGRSGWWLLLVFLPIIGFFGLCCYFC